MKALDPLQPQYSNDDPPLMRLVGPARFLKWPFFLVAFLVIIAALPWIFAFLDRPVVTATHRLVGDHGQDRFIWESITTLGLGYLWIIFFIATSVFCLLGRFTLKRLSRKSDYLELRLGHQRLGRLLINCLSTIAGLILIMPIIYVLKVSIGRVRPGQYVNNDVYLFDPFHRWDLGGALPSGHSADIAAACIGLLLWFSFADSRTPKWWCWTWQLFWLSVMILVATSRIFLWVHFPADTVTGLYLGALAACLGRVLVLNIANRWHKN